MAHENEKLVVGLYANDYAARAAARAIIEWDEEDREDIDLGAISILTINPKTGKLHAEDVGERSTKKGMRWGTVIGATVAILSGGIGLIPGLVIGAAAGAGLGALNHKSVGMTDEQYAKIINRLKYGGAALAIMCDEEEAPAVIAKMAQEGGDVDHYDVPEQTAEVISATATAQAAASAAIDDTADSVDAAEIAAATTAVEQAAPHLDEEYADHVSRIVAATGMSAAHAASYHDAGIEKASVFLALTATPDGRAQLAEETGIPLEAILYEAKKLDLMRINGVGHKFAALLLASGVDSVPELARRNPQNLAAKSAEVNEKEQIVESLPSAEMMAGWIEQAKELPRMLYY